MKVFLWGTGFIADQVMQRCNTLSNYELLGFIDNDLEKYGDLFWGKKVFSPSILNIVETDKIIILANSYEEISRQIVDEYPQYANCIENKNFFYKESILNRYKNCQNPEVIEVINYIKEHGLSVFNYDFANNYLNIDIEIYRDEGCGLYYAIHHGHRMYFSRTYTSKQEVENYYKTVLMEQDINSPHRYLTDDFDVSEGDIVVDVGVAEGIFSLDVVDRVKHLYIVEADSDWIEALKYTFKSYKKKVTIIKGFVSSYDEKPYVTLDSLIKDKVDFIKMDIEGNEWDGLRGAINLIDRSPRLKMAICVYHSDFDQTLVESFLNQNQIRHDATRGFMWFSEPLRQTYVSTSLCKGIVRGYKE